MILALISRHFIGASRYFTWWMELYQIKRPVLKNPWKFKIKIQFLEFWQKFKLKFKILQKIWFLEFLIQFHWIYLIQVLLFGGITFHNLKYLDKPIKCVEMRAKTKSVRKISEILLYIFTYIWKSQIFSTFLNFYEKCFVGYF